MAALVCRHEFVAFAVNMFTPENFCYYDIILERMLKQYSQESGRLLMCLFLDIACQFQKIATGKLVATVTGIVEHLLSPV